LNIVQEEPEVLVSMLYEVAPVTAVMDTLMLAFDGVNVRVGAVSTPTGVTVMVSEYAPTDVQALSVHAATLYI
jgi:hypothetical protein